MATLNLQLNPSGVVTGGAKAENALDDVKASAIGAESALERMGRKSAANLNKATSQTNKLAKAGNNNARQLTQQFSQIADMGAATGQWAKAFLIQLTDISMIFGGPLLIGMATAASVVGAVGLSFLKGRQEGSKFSEVMDQITESTKNANDELEILRLGLNSDEELALTRKISELHEEIASLAAQEAKAQEMQLASMVVVMGKAVEEKRKELAAAEEALVAYRSTTQELAAAEGNARSLGGAVGIVADQATRAADEVQRIISGMLALPQQGVDALRQSEINLQYKGDEVGRAGALAAERFGDVSGFDPILRAGLAEQKQAFIENAKQTAMNREQLKAWQKAQADAGRAASTGASSAVTAASELQDSYESLAESLDPLLRLTNEYKESQATLAAAQAAGLASAADVQRFNDLATKSYEEGKDALSDQLSVYDSLIERSSSYAESILFQNGSIKDSVLGLIQTYAQLILKKNAMAKVEAGGTGFFGSFLPKVFAGMFDTGGTIGMGQTGIVGENGPEVVSATGSGAVVTSRANTARQSKAGGMSISIDARGAQEGLQIKSRPPFPKLSQAQFKLGQIKGMTVLEKNSAGL